MSVSRKYPRCTICDRRTWEWEYENIPSLSPEMYSVSAICIQKCIRNSYLDKIGCAKTKSNIP